MFRGIQLNRIKGHKDPTNKQRQVRKNDKEKQKKTFDGFKGDW